MNKGDKDAGGEGGGDPSAWAAAREHWLGNGDLDEHGVATVIQRALRAKRVRAQDRYSIRAAGIQPTGSD